MTAYTLNQSEAAYQAASLHAEQARVARNAAIQSAVEAGWTHRAVAEATGLTRARVGQIALVSRSTSR